MLNYLYSLIFIFSLGSNCFGQTVDNESSLKREIREVYETYKEIKKSGGFEIMPLEEEERLDPGVCVSCDTLSPLVAEINKIVLKTAENEDEKNPELRTIEKVSGFDALYHYTFNQDFLTDEIECERFNDSNNISKDFEIDFEKSLVLISNEIPIENINALQIRDNKKRTYFYRGQGEDNNIIVRIDVHDSENVNVQYFKVKRNLLENTSKDKKKKKSKKEKKWELWASSSDDEETDEDEAIGDRVDYGAGISIEHNDNIPKKLTLIKGSSYTTVADIFAIKTESEISTKKQIVSMSVSSTDGDDFAKIDLEEDFAELQIPMSVDITNSGLKLNTRYSINSEKEHKVHLTLDGELNSSTSLVFQKDVRGNSIALNRIQRIGSSQEISIQVQGGGVGQSEAWLRYKLAF